MFSDDRALLRLAFGKSPSSTLLLTKALSCEIQSWEVLSRYNGLFLGTYGFNFFTRLNLWSLLIASDNQKELWGHCIAQQDCTRNAEMNCADLKEAITHLKLENNFIWNCNYSIFISTEISCYKLSCLWFISKIHCCRLWLWVMQLLSSFPHSAIWF